jgi:hypothetical protein
MSEILLGAVAYDPAAVTIWRAPRHVRAQGVPMTSALFNYERWSTSAARPHRHRLNTPLAHAVRRRTEGRSQSLGRRLDRDFHARLVVRRDAGMRTPADVHGKTLAVGSRD